MPISGKFEVTVEGKLVTDIKGQDLRDATEDDLRKLGYLARFEPYRAVERALHRALHEEGVLTPGQDVVDAHLNPLRYLFELTTYIGTEGTDLLTREVDTGQLGMDLRAIERVLQLCADGRGLEAADLYRAHLEAKANS